LCTVKCCLSSDAVENILGHFSHFLPQFEPCLIKACLFKLFLLANENRDPGHFFAKVGLLLCVRLNVASLFAHVLKGFFTNYTAKWSLIGMNAWVLSEIALWFKTWTANPTLIRSFSCVHTKMTFQFVSIWKTFLAHGASPMLLYFRFSGHSLLFHVCQLKFQTKIWINHLRIQIFNRKLAKTYGFEILEICLPIVSSF